MASALTMTKSEREAFLADVHVGVLSLDDPSGPPLSAPVWYSYEPGGEIVVVTGRDSRKGALLQGTKSFSLCVQTEQIPYKYVTVMGTVVSIDTADLERDTRPIAHRYLGQELGDGYIEASRVEGETDDIRVRLRPERWLTVDFAKRFGEP